MLQPKPRTVALAITHDRGMLIVNQAGNAGTFVLALPDDTSPVAVQLRALCEDVSIKETKVGSTTIDWGETIARAVNALGAPSEKDDK